MLMGVLSLPFIFFPSKFIRFPAKIWIKGLFFFLKYICRLTHEIRGLNNLSNEPAIIVSKPEVLSSQLGPVAADLLQGRPLHSETWCYLLSRENASDITVSESSDSAFCLITATLP